MTIVQEPPIVPTPEALVQVAIERIQAFYGDDWQPNPSSPEYRLLLAFAAIASEVAVLAVDVPEEIIKFVGEVVYRVNQREATKASAHTTWTISTEAGYTIRQGTVIYVTPEGGEPTAFEVTEEREIIPGNTEATDVPVLAVEAGAAGNSLGTTSKVEPLESLIYVKAIVLDEATSGGTEEETFEEFKKRILELATLITPRPILPQDFAAYARLQTLTDEIGRATAIDEFAPEEFFNTAKGTTTTGSFVLTELSGSASMGVGCIVAGSGIPTTTFEAHTTAPLARLTGIVGSCPVGAYVTGANIPSGTRILSTSPDGTEATMSKQATGTAGPTTVTVHIATIVAVNEPKAEATLSHKATGNHSKETLEVLGAVHVERCVTVAVATSEGKQVADPAREDAEGTLAAAREVSFKSFVLNPTENEIEVEVEGLAEEGQTPAVVEAAVQASLENFIEASRWGVPPTGDRVQWVNEPIVRYQDVVRAVTQTAGLAYYTKLKIGNATTGAPLAEADIGLAGTVATVKFKASPDLIKVTAKERS